MKRGKKWRRLKRAGIEQRQAEAENVIEDAIVEDPGEQQAGEAEAHAARPGEKPPRRVFAHQRRDAGVAVERRDGKQIKCAEQDVQHEKNAQERGGKFGVTGHRGGGHVGETGLVRHVKIPEGYPEANTERGEAGESEIGDGPGERHPCSAMRMPLRPARIVRRAGPTEHPVRREKIREPWDDHRAERLALNVRQGIEAYLSAVKRRQIAAESRDERVRAFMARGGKQEDDIPDDADDQELRTEPLTIHVRAQSKWRA
jgi:hypothetical protein